jgi:tetratricopeptide (TPR) repeat protein
MGKAKRFLIVALLALCSLVIRAQEKNFQEYDRQSLELYNQGNWKQLIRLSNQAFRDGYDYYYLRVRAGIACFETGNYMKAALHFREALAFNEKDAVAGEYLYGCYLQLNRTADAIKVFDELPASVREKLKKSLPKIRQANVETGPVLSNQMDSFDTLDLDGADNIYGEADINQDGYYFNAGLSWGFKKGYSVYGGYSLVKLNKTKMAQIGDTLSVEDQYPLIQHQFYLNGNIPLGKGFSVMPALNIILDRFESVMPRLAEDSVSYLFPVEKTKLGAYIGYLSVTKDFQIVQTSLFAAYSNLNKVNQVQAGFRVVAFPFGNLKFYLSSALLDHINDGNSSIIFEQMLGIRLFKPLWTELNATFGRMENYHENNAFVVYNIADKMTFKGGVKIILMLTPGWIITGEYLYLQREGEYVEYSMVAPPDNTEVKPVTKLQDFQNHIYLIGLKWSF